MSRKRAVRTAVLVVAGVSVLGLAFVAGYGIRGNGSSSTTVKNGTTFTTSGATSGRQVKAPTDSSTTASSPLGNRVGQETTSGGITLTVQSVKRAGVLQYQQDVNEHSKGDPVPATAGGEYVVVQTQLTNNTRQTIDLTCSGPVGAKLIDAQGREFSEIDDLDSLLPGNPECNANTNPGFSVPMTWAFIVPIGTPATAFEFQDQSDSANNAPAARVQLDA